MSSDPRTKMVDGRPVGLGDVAPRLDRAMKNFMAVAYPGRVDLVTRELVRIYSGRQSKCRICANLRLQAAIDRGFDESMVEQLDDPTGAALTDAQKAAVAMARAFLGDPASFDAAGRADLLRHFSPEQVAELLLDLLRFRPGSKLTVVAGNEPAVDELIYS